jgi:hypothetical protein
MERLLVQRLICGGATEEAGPAFPPRPLEPQRDRNSAISG